MTAYRPPRSPTPSRRVGKSLENFPSHGTFRPLHSTTSTNDSEREGDLRRVKCAQARNAQRGDWGYRSWSPWPCDGETGASASPVASRALDLLRGRKRSRRAFSRTTSPRRSRLLEAGRAGHSRHAGWSARTSLLCSTGSGHVSASPSSPRTCGGARAAGSSSTGRRRPRAACGYGRTTLRLISPTGSSTPSPIGGSTWFRERQ